MKLRPLIRATLPAVLFGLALLIGAAAANPAQAFTFEDQAAAPGGAPSAQIADPDDRLTSRYSSGDQSKIQQGNTTFRFGGQGQSFDQRNNPSNYFNPNVLMGK